MIELESLRHSDDVLLDRFRSLAGQTLEANSNQFLQMAKSLLEKETASTQNSVEKNRTEITHLIEPLKTQINSYQEQVRLLEKERNASHVRVEKELQNLTVLSSTLNQETRALKNALKRPHVRGRWGEVQLKNCIELAGMSEFSDVTFQDAQTLDDGQRLIPDMTVRMPGDRQVIVDAKTPIDAFLSSLESTDDESRSAELIRHGRHVKEHVKKLSAKAYSEHLKNSADFTVMFLPNESFLYAALETEPDLVEYAIQRKILIATPPTFIGLLKVIRYGWSEARLTENAQRISAVGIELHKRLVDFLDAFTSVGKYIDKAKQEYETGMSRLESRVITQVKKLEQLGAKSSKNIPDEIRSDFTDPDDEAKNAIQNPL